MKRSVILTNRLGPDILISCLHDLIYIIVTTHVGCLQCFNKDLY